MALTNEFYRTLHILEMNYGSITNVPDDNEDIIRLHKMTQVIDPTRRTTALPSWRAAGMQQKSNGPQGRKREEQAL